ncbi:uncharacterized protein LTR77_005239 [Saxophila tyrrhenica]|uniref:DUF6590 domain-containing protein n=1 Tax=Saxophila tyrrhenica TaxID=1690608 RepID=A0AAV9PC48_9PEZI|nr:hypothetical protein LTR77_005239 [Saxophila tyrrhenica]
MAPKRSDKPEWRVDPNTGQKVRWSESKQAWVNENGKTVSKAKTLPERASSSSARRTDSGSTPTNIPRKDSATAGGSDALARSMEQMAPPSTSKSPVPTAQFPLSGTDPTSQIQTRWGFDPLGSVPNPGGSSMRPVNLKRIREGNGASQTRFQRGYITSEDPNHDYRPSRVIEVLLVPPPQTSDPGDSRITPNGSTGLVRLRRFIIFEQSPDQERFRAVAIKTYNAQGVAAPGVIKAHHSIVYTGQPRMRADERPNDPGDADRMQPHAIRVQQYDQEQALDPLARIDYTDIYELDYDFPNIKLFGKVHTDSWPSFMLQYRSVWATIQGAITGPRLLPTIQDVPEAETPRAGTESVTSARTVVRANPPQSSTASTDHTRADSGPISDAQMVRLMDNLRIRAAQNGWTIGTEPDDRQIHRMARDSERRAQYLGIIRDRWNGERERAAAAAAAAAENVEDDEDDEEEEEQEEEAEAQEEEEEEEEDETPVAQPPVRRASHRGTR